MYITEALIKLSSENKTTLSDSYMTIQILTKVLRIHISKSDLYFKTNNCSCKSN